MFTEHHHDLAIRLAKKSARNFAEEFPGQTLDLHSNWDAEAWHFDQNDLGTDQEHGLSSAQRDELWPVYRDALRREIRRLASRHTANSREARAQ